MIKTFCDRCGNECVNFTFNLSGHIVHTTNKSEQVAYDEVRSLQLCRHCTEIMQAEFPVMVSRSEDYDGGDEMRAAARDRDRLYPVEPLAPVRFYVAPEGAGEVRTDAVPQEDEPVAQEGAGAVPLGSRM